MAGQCGVGLVAKAGPGAEDLIELLKFLGWQCLQDINRLLEHYSCRQHGSVACSLLKTCYR
jgi:hypothetical protein